MLPRCHPGRRGKTAAKIKMCFVFFPQGWASLSAPSLRYFQLRAIYPFLQHYIFVLNSSLYYMHTAHQPPNAIYGCYWLLPDSKWLTATRGQHFNLSKYFNESNTCDTSWTAVSKHLDCSKQTPALSLRNQCRCMMIPSCTGLGRCFLFRSLIQERRKWAQEYKHYSHKLDSLKKIYIFLKGNINGNISIMLP